MRRFIAVILFLGVCSLARADTGRLTDFTEIRPPSTYVSQTVYLSTEVTIKTIKTSEIRISTVPSYLYAVVVTEAGSFDSRLEIFDASNSTKTESRTSDATNAKRLFNIDVSSVSVALPLIPFNIVTSSGIMFNNRGGTACRFTIIWRER